MPCYSPLKAFQIGLTENGKPKYKICSYQTDHVEQQPNGSWIPTHLSMRGARACSVVRSFIEIPCGQCIGCRLQYSRMWADRCMMELQYHKESYFLTLTYDDMHLPRSMYVDPNTGEALTSYTLCKRDLQLFFKRLRKYLGEDVKIRYFACGEYGDSTFRPHYHAIVYGLHLDDLRLYKTTREGWNYYNSDTLTKIWKNGFVVVADVTWETCAYTARYVVKKAKGKDRAFYDLHGLQPEFTVMSRKPGIAKQYFYDHPDIYKYEFINIPTDKGGIKFRPPKYFDRLHELAYPDEMKSIKESRKMIAEDAKKLKLSLTNLSYLDMLKVEEDNKLASIKSLERSL